MINPQEFHKLGQSNQQGNDQECVKHKQPYNSIDLSQMCLREYRLKCSECQQENECVPIDVFSKLCQEMYFNIQKNNFAATESITLQFQKQIGEIQELLQTLNNKLIQISSIERPSSYCLEQLISFINCQQMMKDEISKQSNKNSEVDQIFTKFGIQQFQQLAELLSKHATLNYENFNYSLQFKDVGDQQLAESNQYLDLIQNLKQQILKFQQDNNIKNMAKIQKLNQQQNENFQTNTKDQSLIKIVKSDRLFVNDQYQIADIQLNYDQSTLCIRQMEPNNMIRFWDYDSQKKKFIFKPNFTIYTHSLIDFKMSKIENQFITCGTNYLPNELKISNPIESQYSIQIWRKLGGWQVLQNYQPQIPSGAEKSRISQIIYSKCEKQIFYSYGQYVIKLQKQKYLYEFVYSQQTSSEIITNLQVSNDGNLLAVGALDKRVTLWKMDDCKLVLFQQLNICNTPKRMLFSLNDQDLIICAREGLVLFYNNQESKQKEYKEYQTIFDKTAKIKTIEFNKDTQILAIGGQSKLIQLWKRDPLNKWECYHETEQDEVIESICFSYCPDVIYASNKFEIFKHNLC